MDGVRPVADMLDRFNAISAMMADPPEDADFGALMAEMGELQEKIDAVDGWTLDNQLEIAMDALRCPPGEAGVENLSGGEKRRVALTRLLLENPTFCCSTSQPTISMPNRSAGLSSTCRSTRVRSSP